MNDDTKFAVKRGRPDKESCGVRIRNLGKQRLDPFSGDFPFANQAFHGSINVGWSAFQGDGQLRDQRGIRAGGGFSPSAAEKFDAPVLADFAAAAQQNQTELASTAQVSTAARLQIDSRNFDGAKNP